MAGEETEAKIAEMKQKLAVMEWDVQRNQINPAKRIKYEKLREECKKLEEEYKTMNTAKP